MLKSTAPGPTVEQVARSHDRRFVLAARKSGRGLTLAWLLLGPGMLAMLGENDGASILTSAASGAQIANGVFLWRDGLPDHAHVDGLEPGQIVAAVARPFGRYHASRSVTALLWVVRVFVLLIAAMVACATFVTILH